VGSSNSVFVAGSYQSTVDFGGKTVTSGTNNYDMFLVKLKDQP